MGDKTIVSDRHELTNKGVRLDATALADNGPLLNFYERANEGIFPNSASVEVDGLHDRDVFAKRNIDNPNRPKLRCPHKSLSVNVRWR